MAFFRKILSMRALVTGGTGFIGSHLINFLLDTKKAEVYALVRDPSRLKWLTGLDIHYLKGDLFSIPSLPSNIDTVFHIAGTTKARNSADYYTVNQHGTASLFQALHEQKISPKNVIYLSSMAASGPSPDGNPVKEDGPSHPFNPYGESKLLGEKEALRYKDEFPLVILRVGAVFGSRDTDFLSYFKFIKSGILPLIGSRQNYYSLCYVKDLMKAFDLCLQKNLESGEIINIADPKPYTWEELGREAGKILRKKLFAVKIPVFLLYFIAVISEGTNWLMKKPNLFDRRKLKELKQTGWLADTRKAEKLLSFSPHYGLREALQETLDWYIDKGWL
jgi:dihydroflavonol-4-reductase